MLSHKLFFCVSVELSSRAVSSQVFSPLQRLTSVFGMGTGGPTALKTLTHFVLFQISLAFPFGAYAFKLEILRTFIETRHCRVVHLRGLEPRTH